MNPVDVETCLKSMVILVDTREQDNAKFRKRMEGLQCPFVRHKLDYCDYSAKCTLPDGGEFSLEKIAVIERKMSIDEICGNFTRGRKQFEREFERAKADGAEVFLLVETGSWDKVYKGTYTSRLNPQSLAGSIHAFAERYGIQPNFISRELSGKWIRDKMYYVMREKLLVMGEASLGQS